MQFTLTNMMQRSRLIPSLILIGVMLSACQRPINPPVRVKYWLDRAGSNRSELETVIRHYSNAPKDSLKLKAAYFLIENLAGLITLDTASVAQNDIYLDGISKLWKKGKKPEKFQINKLIDSLNITNKLSPQYNRYKFVPDLTTVSSSLLINDIDRAFEVWNKVPYSKNVGFDDFCNYILPYRCSETYIDDIKGYFRAKHKNVLKHVKNASNKYEVADTALKDSYSDLLEDFVTFQKYPYLQPIKFSNLLKAKFGDCHDVNSIRVSTLRALGIPATIDGIPGWGNSNGKHFWFTIIDNDHKDELITNEQTHISKNDRVGIYHGKSDLDISKYKLISGVQVYYSKFLAKVYREYFKRQPNNLAAAGIPDNDVPEYFKNDRLLDVTDQYVKCSNVKLTLPSARLHNNGYVYLSCFNNINWEPVAWSKVNRDTAVFNKVGINIVYLPVYYHNGKVIPAAAPFLLMPNGTKKDLVPDTLHTQKQTYVLKYPYHPNMVYFASNMIGARFQLANKDDFSDSITVKKITELPFYGTTFKVNVKNKYRYLIYQFKGLPHGDVAEIEFWGNDATGKEVKLTGRLMGNKGTWGTTTQNAFDDDRSNFFVSKKDDQQYIAIDLGKNSAHTVNRIKYTPRNDDNAISMNKSYTLYYWKNGWRPVGEKVATADKMLTFDNVPGNALLLIKDNEGGTENRIFTYTGNKQLFY